MGGALQTLLVSLVLPPTVFLLTKHLVLKPLSRSRKKQKALLLRQRHAQEVAVAMQNVRAPSVVGGEGC